jgi:hypothetical protein
MKKTIMIFALFTTLAITSYAQTATPRADTRQGAQRARIHEGRKEGELTNREASALNSQQRSVRRLERRVKADGEVSTKEKVRIEKKQDRASRHIRRAKSNKIESN